MALSCQSQKPACSFVYFVYFVVYWTVCREIQEAEKVDVFHFADAPRSPSPHRMGRGIKG